MPYNDPDPSDPNVLVGVVLPADAEAMREMAYVFAEEFARMGYDKESAPQRIPEPVLRRCARCLPHPWRRGDPRYYRRVPQRVGKG